jgi:hypothetical protein
MPPMGRASFFEKFDALWGAAAEFLTRGHKEAELNRGYCGYHAIRSSRLARVLLAERVGVGTAFLV